jgi:hypothetical protein
MAVSVVYCKNMQSSVVISATGIQLSFEAQHPVSRALMSERHLPRE